MGNASEQARYVPTLTEIVEAEDLAHAAALEIATLTDVVAEQEPVSEHLLVPDSLAHAQTVQAQPPHAWSEALAEQMVHRVVQRVDAVLTQRIGEVVAAVVEAQTRALLPSLRQELEFAVRTSVNEAVADELLHMDAALKKPD